MAVSSSFIDFAKETFAPFGEITVKRMFGGAGVYCDGLFFAILDDGAVYLKVDDVTRAEFEGAGLEAFVFEMKDGSSGTMNYHNAPDAIYDDGEALRHWTTLALDAASRAARLKPKKKKAAKKSAKKASKPTSLKAKRK